jgi:hypothetical protein
MKKNYEKDARIPDEELAKVDAACGTLEDFIKRYGVTFSLKERQTCLKTGLRRKGFVDSARDFAKNLPDVLPRFLDVELFMAHCDNNDALTALWVRLEGIVRQIKDTAWYAGNQALEPAHECYASAKRAMHRKIPGAENMFKRMRECLRGGARTAAASQVQDASLAHEERVLQ